MPGMRLVKAAKNRLEEGLHDMVRERDAGPEQGLLEAGVGGASLREEHLRRDVEVGARRALREAQGARRAITLSIGVAGREAGVKGGVDLFEGAERALRKAKDEGRNRVVLG